MLFDESPQSPQWWVRRLHALIVSRASDIRLYDEYYAGTFRAPWLAPGAEREFQRLLAMTSSPYMALVADATTERLQVEGFRVGSESPEPDRETWRIWQENGMDSESDDAISKAIVRGRSFMSVAPNYDDKTTPFIFVEDALQTAVEYVPGTGRRVRAAALKVWLDDWTGVLMATLYLPDLLYKFQSAGKYSLNDPVATANVEWVSRTVPGEPWPVANPLGKVPIVEFTNMTKEGQSEIHDVMGIQDRIGKTIADRLMTQDYGAFPQKWATGYPDLDKDSPIATGQNRLVATDAIDTRFGQWEGAALDPYSTAKAEDVNDIAARTRTPPQYLLGRMANMSGDALKAAESGLVAKVKRRQRTFSDSFEEVARLARQAAGLPAGDSAGMETVWRNPEIRSQSELVDALVKLRTLGVPYEALWEQAGASPQERERWKQMAADELTMPVFEALAPPEPAPAPPADPAVEPPVG